MASVGRNRRKDSGILTKKNTQEKGKTTGRMASTIMETDDKSSDSEEEEQEKEVGRVTRGKLNKSCNKMAELKNKMKKKIKEKKIEISDPRSRIYSGNSSFVRKKLSSLKTNNRELASTLAASRHGVRKLQNQNLGLQRENHALAERVITLQGRVRELQAALRHKKDNEQEYKRKMLNVQSVLQKVSTSLLGTVEHIGSAMEVCHPALRDSGWRISSLSAGVSASDDSDGSLAPQPRLSVLGPGPARVPLPAGKRQSLAPPGNRASMRLSVSVPPPLLSTEPQESSVQQATPRDSIADLESAPILFTDEGTETDKQSTTDIAEPDNPACIAADIPDKPVDSSGQNTTKQVHKKGDKRATFVQPQNTSRQPAVPVTEDRRNSTLDMPPPVKVPSKSSSGQNRRGTYTVPSLVPVSVVVNKLPCDARRGTYTVSATVEAPPEVPEKRASLMDLVAEHKRKSRDATGQESCLSKSQESAVDPPAVTDPTDDTYTEQDMDLTVVPATVISTEETAQAMEDASQETNTGRPADKDAKKNAVPKKGKTSQKDLNQSGCKPVRRVKKKKTSKLPTFVKSTKTTAERREEVGKDRDEIVDEERKTQEVPMQETSEGFSENADVAKSSQESETELEEFDADDTTYPKPVWALQQGQQVIPENSVPRRVSSLADDSDDNFVNKRGKKAARRIVSTDSESEIDRDMIAGLVSSENESRPDFAMKKKKQKGVTERNVKVSTKMTKKGLVVQSTSTKTSAKDVEDTTAASGQEKRGRESDSVFDLSSGDMFSEPSPLTLKPVVSREHTSQDDDHKQGHSRVGKPKKQGKSKKKVGSANKKKQDVLVTESESSDEEDEEENYARRGKTSKNRKDIPMIPETPGSLQEDDVRQQHVTGRRDTNRQSDEGHIARPRRRATTAVKYFTSDSESEDDCWQGRKSRQPRSTRRSSNYSLSEEEENTGTRMPLRRTPQRLLQSAEKGPLAARQGRVYRDSSDTDATTPHVEKASSKRRAFQDVGNTPQGHSDTAGTKTKVTPQTGPKNQKKRPFSSVGSCDEAPDVEQSHAVQNENAEDQSAGGAKRARRSRQQVSYKEPTLNSKLRRGDPMTIKFGDWSPQHQKNKHKTGKKFSK
ncbi:NK-tumor recognition protein-like isoform X2 [Branchiostoma lanceolatum]|uniref:NK-tumor recognition protein-like isoform X2 n=1 Tax=Branchiostoma lanceolatum TaxID=7740 RepID=UPI0034572085